MRSTFLVPLLFPCALALAGCGGGDGSDTNRGGPLLGFAPIGMLGASNIALQVTAAGGSVTLPCGDTGQITQPLTLDATGHFDVTGTLTEGGGPPLMTPISPIPARFTGTTDGKTMTLTVTPAPLGAPTGGPYTLTYGAPMTTNIGGCPG